MSLFAVIADDLTGAGDTGAQFAATGLKTRVFLNWADINLDDDPEVVVLNTDTRARKPEHARAVVAEAARELRKSGISNLYKKIDSTLRGNLGQEIEAILDAFDFDLALVSPSFPANGRVVVGGFLLVNGELVSRTALAQDPVLPVRESFIPALLAQQTGLPIGHLPISLVARGEEEIAEFLRSAKRRGERIIVADSLSDNDLSALVQGVNLSGIRAFFVGSAGLALPVARSWSLRQKPLNRELILVVCGSVNPKSREQIGLVADRPGWEIITIDPVGYLEDAEGWEDSLRKLLEQEVRGTGLEGLILTTPGTPKDVAAVKEAAERMGRSIEGIPNLVSHALALATGVTMNLIKAKGFVLTGGDTAYAVLKFLGGRGLDITSEVSPGVPVGRVVGGQYDRYPVVTKAGGFGGTDVLWQAILKLKSL